MNRGNYRQRIFSGKGAAEAFERVLGGAAERFGWRVHAYVIMSNHFHLAVELGEPNLSEGMKWLQGTWEMVAGDVDSSVQSFSELDGASVSGALQGDCCGRAKRGQPTMALR
ncbi:transposase [Puniceicoccus vermicola]|uniref:Transposase n=1 Tax=Puniceicoccus vermicola TaxID=388746 RepID=A0A7X1E5I2_9BACT|nr:transposase [Puniceicoccus vermicola]